MFLDKIILKLEINIKEIKWIKNGKKITIFVNYYLDMENTIKEVEYEKFVMLSDLHLVVRHL